MIVRLADAFGWDVPDWDRLMQRAPAMLEGGYAMRAVVDRAAMLHRSSRVDPRRPQPAGTGV